MALAEFGDRAAGREGPMARADCVDEAAWPARARAALGRLPAGTVEAARASVRRGLEAAGVAGDRRVWLDDIWLEARLAAPLMHEEDWPSPAPPVPVGDGAVHADLVGPDLESFGRLRSALTAEPGGREIAAEGLPVEPGERSEDGMAAERLAAEAQIWRLPVTPYRRLADAARALAVPPNRPTPPDVAAPSQVCGDGPTASDNGPSVRVRAVRGDGAASRVRRAEPTGRRRGRDQPLVVDLTALWAGPLATALLADLGAEVVKVDPAARPDGLARHRAFHHHLNSAKQVVDLDLRDDSDRRRFEALLDRANLLIDSFSRRVMPNFGYGRPALAARWPRLAALSITAFPTSTAEADWIAYGPGVHAIMGLGDRGPDPGRSFEPAPVAYPDALAGLAAFASAAELLARGPSAPASTEVSLAAAVAPLTRLATAKYLNAGCLVAVKSPRPKTLESGGVWGGAS